MSTKEEEIAAQQSCHDVLQTLRSSNLIFLVHLTKKSVSEKLELHFKFESQFCIGFSLDIYATHSLARLLTQTYIFRHTMPP